MKKKSETLASCDKFGGCKIRRFPATGFFRLHQLGDRWILITPEGHPFYMIGINGVTPWFGDYRENGFNSNYQCDMTKWGREAVRRITSWGFNCLTYRTADQLVSLMIKDRIPRMPYAPVLEYVEPNALKRREEDFPDVWSDDFKSYVEYVTFNSVPILENDPYLLGYFLGNELDFDITPPRSWRNRWVKKLLRQEPETPARQQFTNLLRERYKTIESFNSSYGSEFDDFESISPRTIQLAFQAGAKYAEIDVRRFNAALAKQFYKVTTESIRRYDTNHLIFSARFGGHFEPEVVTAISDYCDVIAGNKYSRNAETLEEHLSLIYRYANKPIHHSEFSFLEWPREGTYPGVCSQRERGVRYVGIVQSEIEIPESIGFAWYCYTEPKGSINFGLIDIHDNVYEEAVSYISEANDRVMMRFQEIVKETVVKKTANFDR